MSRASDSEVRAIIDNDSSIPMTPFIAAASAMVDYVDSKDTDNLLSLNTLHQIEVWLAAHFYNIRDSGYHARSTGKASGQFQGKTEMRLSSSLWGQTAMVLDVTGTLARLDSSKDGRKKVGIVWLGKPKSSQIDYGDRD